MSLTTVCNTPKLEATATSVYRRRDVVVCAHNGVLPTKETESIPTKHIIALTNNSELATCSQTHQSIQIILSIKNHRAKGANIKIIKIWKTD